MNDTITLPAFPDKYLGVLALPQLINLLIENEDRVPRNVIDYCASRGDDMTAQLRKFFEEESLWEDEEEDDDEENIHGKWWLQHHAAMILGLIPTEQAGLLLVELMRRFARNDDEMQDWISGYWPALFQNKPDCVLPALRAFVEDRQIGEHLRANAMDAIVAPASRQGGDALEQTLAWLGAMAEDESDNWEFRLMVGGLLLHFPREQYRPLLESMAQQQGFMARFLELDVREAFAGNPLSPHWLSHTDPWQFYTPGAITQRLRRRIKQTERNAQLLEQTEKDFPIIPSVPPVEHDPFIRPEAKIGRNAPCPCGSGKKYKKCCLAGA